MSAKPWQSYWQSHATHNSFMHEYESGEGPYGVIDSYWQSVFDMLPNDAVVADLGAGNGALSHLYIKHKPLPQCKAWHNIDYAHIQAPSAHPCITHTQADMHALPFADNSVDVVVSMYGIEYSDLSRTLSEVHRVLTPNGQCVLVMHHPKSIITQQSKITLAVINSLLQEPMLTGFDNVKIGSIDALKSSCFKVLTTHLHQVPENAQEDVKLIGQKVFNILQSNAPLVDLIHHLKLLGQDIAAQAERLSQQIEAAQQAAQMQSNEMPFSVTNTRFNTLDFAAAPIALTLIATK